MTPICQMKDLPLGGSTTCRQESLEPFIHIPLSKHHICYRHEVPGQCERYNGIIWKGVHMAPRTQNMSDTQWEIVLPNVLHSIRSLLS